MFFNLKESSFLTSVLVILLVVGLVIAIPLVAIWAINTLFLTAIPITFYTWVAAFFLIMVIQGKNK